MSAIGFSLGTGGRWFGYPLPPFGNGLGQRLFTETKDSAARLPPDYAAYLRSYGSAERFDIEEFCRRVPEEGLGTIPRSGPSTHRAVTDALREAVGAEYRHPPRRRPGGA